MSFQPATELEDTALLGQMEPHQLDELEQVVQEIIAVEADPTSPEQIEALAHVFRRRSRDYDGQLALVGQQMAALMRVMAERLKQPLN